MNKIEAVIFDWAGTTVDYGCFAPVQAFVEAFRQYGVFLTVEEVRKPMGIAKRDHIKEILEMERISAEWEKLYEKPWNDDDVEHIYRKSESILLEILNKYAEPNPFVLDTVKKLRGLNIKIGSTTGYNDEMMSIVVPKAKELGYSPDVLCTPNSADNMGRPYPYMVFNNMRALKISSVNAVIKVGDTVADIKEGKNAGVVTVGIIEGSSLLALSKLEYENLPEAKRLEACLNVRKIYEDCGADYVINNMSELIGLIEKIETSKESATEMSAVLI